MIDERELPELAGDLPSPRDPKRRRIWLAVAKIFGFALSVALVGWVVANASKGVKLDEENILLFFVAMLPAAAAWLYLGWAWSALSGARAWDGISTWARSQALRYIPGSIWSQAARATSVEGSTGQKASAVVAESAITLSVSAAVGGALLAVDGSWHWALLVALPAMVPLAAHLTRWRHMVSVDALLRATGRNVVSSLLYGATIAISQLALGPLHHPLSVVGAGCLARAAGMVAVFSPGGVGVREVAYIALVSGFLPQDVAAAGAIGSRLVLTAAELGVLVVLGVPWLTAQVRHFGRHQAEELHQGPRERVSVS